jgi:hypothetical protein
MKSIEICANVFDARYAVVHVSRMPHDIPALLRKMMEIIPTNQAGLAARISTPELEVDQPQISRWIKGQEPKHRNYDRIVEVAAELGLLGDVRSEDVAALIDPGPKKTIRVKGYVGAGGEAHFYNVASLGDLDTIEATDKDTDQTVAVRIIGKSLGEVLSGWYVTYDDVRSPITDDLLGELCVVGLSDDRILVKKVVRNGKRDLFNLISNAEKEPVIEGVKIEWAAKVTAMRPK